MNKPSIVVLAAGMGSRYGSLKQMDGVGPSGEAILDYSVYDAARAGFGKVIFVIRRDFEQDFKEIFNKGRFCNAIDIEYVFQELDDLPGGFAVPEGRTKPWGTNHAILSARRAIDGPFAVINADDFYGREAYREICDFLSSDSIKEGRYCMAGYMLENTLSENGTVSRGVCEVDSSGMLISITERTSIERTADGIVYRDENGEHPLGEKTPVSMNLFGFTPDYMRHSGEYFKEFLKNQPDPLKSEFYIPSMVTKLVNDAAATMKVIPTQSKWFGVTYKEDKPAVEARLRELVEEGKYPEKLWK